MHQQGFQRQMGVGRLVSSQERKALFVPLINRLSTAHFCFPPSFQVGIRLFVLPKSRSGKCLRFAGGQEVWSSPGRIDHTAPCPTQPRAAQPPSRTPPRRDWPVVCAGFGFDRLMQDLSGNQLISGTKSALRSGCCPVYRLPFVFENRFFYSRHVRVREIIVIPLLPKFFPGEVTWVRISLYSAIGNRV